MRWLDYRATTAPAREYVVVATNALAQQTKEALQTASLILARTLDHIDGKDWPAISRVALEGAKLSVGEVGELRIARLTIEELRVERVQMPNRPD